MNTSTIEPVGDLVRGWAGAARETGTSRVQLWRRVRAGTFPAPIELGPNSVAWFKTEIAPGNSHGRGRHTDRSRRLTPGRRLEPCPIKKTRWRWQAPTGRVFDKLMLLMLPQIANNRKSRAANRNR
jgi:hypothetical protein